MKWLCCAKHGRLVSLGWILFHLVEFAAAGIFSRKSAARTVSISCKHVAVSFSVSISFGWDVCGQTIPIVEKNPYKSCKFVIFWHVNVK